MTSISAYTTCTIAAAYTRTRQTKEMCIGSGAPMTCAAKCRILVAHWNVCPLCAVFAHRHRQIAGAPRSMSGLDCRAICHRQKPVSYFSRLQFAMIDSRFDSRAANEWFSESHCFAAAPLRRMQACFLPKVGARVCVCV